MSWISYVIFFAVIALTLYITYWAAQQTTTASDFYTAGGSLTGWQNGMAIAGDYLSAASFLGIAGAISLNGFDGFYYSIGWLTAYLVVLFLIAEPLRNLGKFTMADMIGARFGAKKVRGAAALNTITIVMFYMLAQLVGAGALIKLLFGIEYWIAVLIVGTMMLIYVLFGGMTATSWVQIVKAILLMLGTIIISFLVLMKFNFNFISMFETMKTATPHGEAFLHSGVVYTDTIGLISVLIALVLGTAGLPHILMRFFTVKDAKTARSSVIYSVWIIGIFYVLTIFLGFGAAKFVGADAIIAENAAGNMAAPMLAGVLGGDALESFVAAVAFATILAVVAGLVLSGASAIAHDIYGQIFKNGNVTEKQQVNAARWASIAIGVFSILLALGSEKLNVAFLVSLAFCVAASANVPTILLTIYWKRFNTTGAVASMLTGLIVALVLVAISPSVMNPVEGATLITGNPIFPYANPAIVSVPAGFLAAVIGTLVSSKRHEKDEVSYAEVRFKAETGYKELDL
ncbi:MULTISPECIES: cation acetate symporter [unclassified Sporosarcina]|uniref:solute symporter family protein n=1 Tax=unclassified Sporosarcina TaxID=2647733 RepID=UPI000C171D13|nr:MULTISPECIES: cation acetate symporter [unclassified Sporosarcina]PID00844.1 cation acetate symporter [Sporosarcina sp. P29]PID07097.1 cation acetate symporter [Sporosarcina sp. P30]PID10293.1 cation acetate symporter [Sporosarcina sp. P31]PID12191.1 cation acetate symporter [Sporosarcina sp. P32b]